MQVPLCFHVYYECKHHRQNSIHSITHFCICRQGSPLACAVVAEDQRHSRVILDLIHLCAALLCDKIDVLSLQCRAQCLLICITQPCCKVRLTACSVPESHHFAGHIGLPWPFYWLLKNEDVAITKHVQNCPHQVACLAADNAQEHEKIRSFSKGHGQLAC